MAKDDAIAMSRSYSFPEGICLSGLRWAEKATIVRGPSLCPLHTQRMGDKRPPFIVSVATMYLSSNIYRLIFESLYIPCLKHI